jgi:hypothetical protein
VLAWASLPAEADPDPADLSEEKLGLQSERAHMKWAYLMSVSDGVFATAPETKQFFAESARHPDNRIDDLMDMFDALWTEAEKAR